MTGIYDLVAVLTHKGRSADSGHYVAWVKQENGWFSEAYLHIFNIQISLYKVLELIYFCWQENGLSLMMIIPNHE